MLTLTRSKAVLRVKTGNRAFYTNHFFTNIIITVNSCRPGSVSFLAAQHIQNDRIRTVWCGMIMRMPFVMAQTFLQLYGDTKNTQY